MKGPTADGSHCFSYHDFSIKPLPFLFYSTYRHVYCDIWKCIHTCFYAIQSSHCVSTYSKHIIISTSFDDAVQANSEATFAPIFPPHPNGYRVSPQTYWCLTVIHLVWLSLMAIQRPSVFTLWPEFQVGCSSGCYALLFYLWMSSWKTANKALFRLQWEEIFVILCSILWLQGKGFGKCTYLLKGWTAKLRLLIRSPSSLKHICSSEHFTSSL